MRVILKSKSTDLYFKSTGNWVESEYDARSFEDVSKAFQFCALHNLDDASVVLKFGSGLQDLTLNPPPVSARV
jgi:hypothetical protein